MSRKTRAVKTLFPEGGAVRELAMQYRGGELTPEAVSAIRAAYARGERPKKNVRTRTYADEIDDDIYGEWCPACGRHASESARDEYTSGCPSCGL